MGPEVVIFIEPLDYFIQNFGRLFFFFFFFCVCFVFGGLNGPSRLNFSLYSAVYHIKIIDEGNISIYPHSNPLKAQ